ncbi:conserved hypothetical protein [uncultured Gammaproteobacteria bacterium]
MVDQFVQHWLMNSDGTFKVASTTFHSPTEFETLLEQHLRHIVLELLGDLPEIHRARWQKGSPFRGLESFEIEHAQIFFGRTQARNIVREQLTAQVEAGLSFLLVTGASGSGKSSLVKAGLLPDLLLPGMLPGIGMVRWAVMRPSDGSDPSQALSAALLSSQALPDLPVGRAWPPESAEHLAQAVTECLHQQARKMELSSAWRPLFLLVVDQLEELFAETVGTDARAAFVVALERLTRQGNTAVVATLRSDYYDRLERVPQLAAMSAGAGCVLLLAPNDAEIGQIIVQPAHEAGLSYQMHPTTGIPLHETLRAATTAEAGVLPLLQFTLEQLWQRRTELGELTYDAYAELGGLKGAIGQRAEDIFQAQPPEVQKALPKLLFTLARVEQGGKGKSSSILARPAMPSAWTAGSPESLLAEAMLAVEARLLVKDEQGLLRVAHEALLSHWPRAADIVNRDRADLELRARLDLSEALWRSAATKDQESLLLHPGLPLVEAEDLLARRKSELETHLVTFISVSSLHAQAKARKKLRRLKLVASGFAILAAMAIGFAIMANYQSMIAKQQRRAAEIQLEVSLAGRGTLLAKEQHWSEAKSVFRTAIALDDQSERSALPVLLGFANANMRTPDPYTMVDMEDAVTAVAVAPDDKTMAVGLANGVIVWMDRLTGRRISRTVDHNSAIAALAFLEGGRYLVSIGRDALVQQIEVATHRVQYRNQAPDLAIRLAVPVPALNQLVVLAEQTGESGKGQISFMRLESGEWTRTINIATNETQVSALAVTPDGSRLLLGSIDATLQVNLKDLSLMQTLSGSIGLDGHVLMNAHYVTAIAISDDGQSATIGTSDGVLEQWDLQTNKQIHSSRVVLSGINTVILPTGSRDLALIGTNTALLAAEWDVTSHIKKLQSDIEPVTALARLGDGGAVSGGEDRKIAVFEPIRATLDEVAKETMPRRLTDLGLVPRLDISKGQKFLLSYGILDRELTFLDAGLGRILTTQRLPSTILRALFLPEPGKILVAMEKGRLVVWNMVEKQEERVLLSEGAEWKEMEVARGVPRAVTVDAQEMLTLWDTHNGVALQTWKANRLEKQESHIALSDRGEHVVLGHANALTFWRVGQSQPVWSTAFKSNEVLMSMACSADGKRVVSGHSNGLLRVWDGADGRVLATIHGHEAAAMAVAITTDGQHIVSGGREGTLKIWSAETFKEMFSAKGIPPVFSVLVAPNGTVIAGVMGDSKVYGKVDALMWSPGRVAHYLATEQGLPMARAALGSDPAHVPSLETMRRWFALRHDWVSVDAVSMGVAAPLAELLEREKRSEALAALQSLVSATTDPEEQIYLNLWQTHLQNDPKSFFLAAENNDMVTLDAMIGYGISLNVTDPEGMTVLHYAVRNGHLEVLKRLLAAGADPTVKDNYGRTPLLANMRLDISVADLFLRADGDINAQDKEGRTLLHFAAFQGNKESIRYLLDHGARRDIKDTDGKTAYDHALHGTKERDAWEGQDILDSLK